ncbi:MAG: SCP2 sterol-binding domain-containing protein, partial [Deltaproteobacteria bacterium]|nr:SCP2 sterol-binding domain-containing protein [Deltaproteobacteria bacterium]
QVNAIQAFMGGKLKLTGNMMLAQKIQDLFKF